MISCPYIYNIYQEVNMLIVCTFNRISFLLRILLQERCIIVIIIVVISMKKLTNEQERVPAVFFFPSCYFCTDNLKSIHSINLCNSNSNSNITYRHTYYIHHIY